MLALLERPYTHLEYVDQTQAIYHPSILTPTLGEVYVVCEFLDVFPEALFGMPPDRDIEFIITLVPGTALLAIG